MSNFLKIGSVWVFSLFSCHFSLILKILLHSAMRHNRLFGLETLTFLKRRHFWPCTEYRRVCFRCVISLKWELCVFFFLLFSCHFSLILKILLHLAMRHNRLFGLETLTFLKRRHFWPCMEYQRVCFRCANSFRYFFFILFILLHSAMHQNGLFGLETLKFLTVRHFWPSLEYPRVCFRYATSLKYKDCVFFSTLFMSFLFDFFHLLPFSDAPPSPFRSRNTEVSYQETLWPNLEYRRVGFKDATFLK